MKTITAIVAISLLFVVGGFSCKRTRSKPQGAKNQDLTVSRLNWQGLYHASMLLELPAPGLGETENIARLELMTQFIVDVTQSEHPSPFRSTVERARKKVEAYYRYFDRYLSHVEKLPDQATRQRLNGHMHAMFYGMQLAYLPDDPFNTAEEEPLEVAISSIVRRMGHLEKKLKDTSAMHTFRVALAAVQKTSMALPEYYGMYAKLTKDPLGGLLSTKELILDHKLFPVARAYTNAKNVPIKLKPHSVTEAILKTLVRAQISDFKQKLQRLNDSVDAPDAQKMQKLLLNSPDVLGMYLMHHTEHIDTYFDGMVKQLMVIVKKKQALTSIDYGLFHYGLPPVLADGIVSEELPPKDVGALSQVSAALPLHFRDLDYRQRIAHHYWAIMMKAKSNADRDQLQGRLAVIKREFYTLAAAGLITLKDVDSLTRALTKNRDLRAAKDAIVKSGVACTTQPALCVSDMIGGVFKALTRSEKKLSSLVNGITVDDTFSVNGQQLSQLLGVATVAKFGGAIVSRSDRDHVTLSFLKKLVLPTSTDRVHVSMQVAQKTLKIVFEGQREFVDAPFIKKALGDVDEIVDEIPYAEGAVASYRVYSPKSSHKKALALFDSALQDLENKHFSD